jgi:Flp pilus assembly protein TadG
MNPRSESGAIAVQAVLLMMMLGGMTAFVVDHGMLLVARAEAQNAADSAAIAGAYSRATVNEEPAVVATQAINMARANKVWMAEPSIAPADVTVETCQNPEGWWAQGDECITATVYRTTARGNALPTLFARFFGLEWQNVSARATARVMGVSSTDCMRPWAIADRWLERSDEDGNPTGVWEPDSTYDTVYASGPNKGEPLPNPDVYIPPSPKSTGTGFTTADYGREIVLKRGSHGSGFRAGWYGRVSLPRGNDDGSSHSAQVYKQNIESCNGVRLKLGDEVLALQGNVVGPTKQGVDTLMDDDPGAFWDKSKKRIKGGCMEAGDCAKSSRLVAVGVFDPNLYKSGNQSVVKIVNLVGFFIDEIDDDENVIGHLTYYPAIADKQAPAIPGQSSFLKAAVLAR